MFAGVLFACKRLPVKYNRYAVLRSRMEWRRQNDAYKMYFVPHSVGVIMDKEDLFTGAFGRCIHCV